MNKNTALTIILSILILFVQGCDRPWTGSIRGTVTVTDTEEVIPGVMVVARSMKNGYAVSTVTDGEGNYRLHDVRWGPNRVRVYHPRYYPSEKFADVIRETDVTLDFSVSERSLYMDTDLHVHVQNAHGHPINQAVVDLYQFKKSIYDYYFYLATRTTAEDGYLVFSLPRIYEDQILQLQLRIAALGYHDVITDVMVTWGTEDPAVTIVMEDI
jgi:hypothetical protein